MSKIFLVISLLFMSSYAFSFDEEQQEQQQEIDKKALYIAVNNAISTTIANSYAGDGEFALGDVTVGLGLRFSNDVEAEIYAGIRERETENTHQITGASIQVPISVFVGDDATPWYTEVSVENVDANGNKFGLVDRTTPRFAIGRKIIQKEKFDIEADCGWSKVERQPWRSADDQEQVRKSGNLDCFISVKAKFK